MEQQEKSGNMQENYLKKELYQLIKTDESIFDFIQESSLDGLWYWDLENPENEWMNPKFWTVLGYNPDEMPHKSSAWQNIVNEDDLKVAMENFARHCENPDHPYDQIVRYTHKNGSTVWIRCRGLAIRDDNGRPVRMLGAHNDVTEYKKTADELIKTEKKSSIWLENSPVCTKIVDLDFNLQYMSQSGVRELKIDDISKYYGKPYPFYFYPDSFKVPMNKNLREAKATGRIVTQEAYVTNIEGEILWYHSTIVPVFNSSNELDYIMVVSLETTKRKEAELELIKAKEKAEENEKRYRNLLQNLHAGVVVHAPDASIQYVNHQASELLGLGIEHLMGKKAADLGWNFIQEDYQPLAIGQFPVDYVINNGTAYAENILGIKRPNTNDLVWVLVKAFPEFNADNTIRQVVVTFIDITDRRRAEEALKQSELQNRTILQTAIEGFWIVDIKGRFTDVNNAYCELTGYSREEILSMSITDVEVQEDTDQVSKHLKQLLKNGSDRFETKHRRKDGRIIDVEISANLMKDDEKIFVFVHDLTERKKAEDVHKELEIANQTAQFKQNFLANMSHEIRTPLTGVLGMIEIMEQTVLSPNQKDYLDTIKISGENLREIINQVLDYSKIEAGKIALHPQVFEFRSLPLSAISLYKNNVKTRVKFQNTIDPNIPLWIEADNARLAQVLNNLVSNAVKFTSEGVISIQSSLVSAKPQKGQVVIKLEVTDTGPGIPEDLHQKLFIPFSQIEALDTRNSEGTGLGLSICKQLVEMMGGEIGMTSEEGNGSSFWFTFPAQIANKTDIALKEKDAGLFSGKLRILLAEDKTINQKVVKLMLTSMGHEVRIAKNGQEAIELFQPGLFDLILMDIQMPVMNGITATQILKEKYTTLPPIVGLSANAFEGDRPKYMALGMDEYLTKPVRKNDFELLIKKLIF
jgi:PAS domain S-box-containing protein